MFILAIIYLSLPVFIILFSFLSSILLIPTSIALTLLIFALNKQLRGTDVQSYTLLRYWPLLLISFVMSYLCVLFPMACHDWDKHYSMFNELITNYWPPTKETNGQTWVLRYYLGWYAVPALFAKIFGTKTLPLAIFIWTACGLFISLQLIFYQISKIHHFFIAALVLFSFSGLDMIGIWLAREEIPSFYADFSAWWGVHRWGGGHIPVVSVLQTFVYAPQHAVGGALMTGLLLYNCGFAAQWGAVIVVVAAMWSPFAAMGTLPLVGYAVFREGYRSSLTPQNLIATPLLTIPVVLYLSAGDTQTMPTFVWERPKFSLYNLALLYVFKFLLMLGVFYQLRLKERGLIIPVGLFLAILCCFSLGEFNDIVMRGTLPSVFIMAAMMCKCLLENKGWCRELLIAYILVCGLPVAVAFEKSITRPRANVNATFEETVFLDDIPWGQGRSYFHLFFVPTTNIIRNAPLAHAE